MFRFPTRALEFTKISIQAAAEICSVGEEPFVGK
jgi:hypothetical protein